MSTWKIREIQAEDNQQVRSLIREVLVEMGVPKVGTAYEDRSLDDMTKTYNAPKMAYFIVEENGKVIGSAGIAPLTGLEEEYCELQKMYFFARSPRSWYRDGDDAALPGFCPGAGLSEMLYRNTSLHGECS